MCRNDVGKLGLIQPLDEKYINVNDGLVEFTWKTEISKVTSSSLL